VVARHGPALTRGALADMRWADAMAREVLRLRGPAEGLFRCGPAAPPPGSALQGPAPRLLAAGGARRARLAGAAAANVSAKQAQAAQRRADARPLPRRRIAKQDFELHGRRVRKGASLYLSGLYAKACDGRVSAGDHVATPMPAHMDMADLAASFRPERWLGPELDKAVRARAGRPADAAGAAHTQPVYLCLGTGLGCLRTRPARPPPSAPRAGVGSSWARAGAGRARRRADARVQRSLWSPVGVARV